MTVEDIDKVRKIANMATGRLPVKIIEALLKKSMDGIRIKIIYIHGKGAKQPTGLGTKDITKIEVRTTEDLEREVRMIMTTEKVDYFIHTMAVADHRPTCVSSREVMVEFVTNQFNQDILDEERRKNIIDMIMNPPRLATSSGEISSKVSPVIFTEPTPKVLNLIKLLQPWTFLVGFKLLHDESEGSLFDIGFGSMIRGEPRCNMVVGNYLNLIRQGAQQAIFVYSEKTSELVEGRDSIAELLVERMFMRGETKHSRSVHLCDYEIPSEIFSKFQSVGFRLYEGGYLPEVPNLNKETGTYGNMSVMDKGSLYITCRNVHKGKLETKGGVCLVSRVVGVKEPSVYAQIDYCGYEKPSIDTCIHHNIYALKRKQGKDVKAMIHIHTDKLFADMPLTACNYPCGTREEMITILNAIRDNPGQEIIQLYKHGLIIMGESLEDCYAKIEKLFKEGVSIELFDCSNSSHRAVSVEWEEHYKLMNPETYPMLMDYKKNTYIVRRGSDDAGIIFIDKDGDDLKFVLFTTESFQNKGLGVGEKILSILALLAENVGAKNLMVITKDLCGVAGYYKIKQGFVEVPSNTEYILLKRSLDLEGKGGK